MPNALGNYNETFFAQEALIQLEKALGMAGRVHRGYDPAPRAKGETISIRRPSSFTAQNAPSSAQDLSTESVNITLNQWREVKIKLTDKELSLSAEQLVTDHIRPAAYALADDIDQKLNALYLDIPNYYQLNGTFALGELASVNETLFNLNVPMTEDGSLALEVSGGLKTKILTALGASGMQPNQQDGALRRGSMGTLFGMETFANQNVISHTSGVGADATGTIDGVNPIGDTTIVFSGVTAGITWKAGDTFSISGDPQRYVFTADGTDADGTACSATCSPLKKATVGAEVITIHLGGAAKKQNLAFHRNAFALAMAPLSEMGAEFGGARIASVFDPITNLALRARMFYVGDESAVYVALDCLYGLKTLDQNLAARVYDA